MQFDREKLTFFGVLALIVVLIAAGFIIRETWDRAPGDDSAEAGFLRDMQVHHEQAVVMAMIIRDRTEDGQLAAMATDIAFSQTSQMGEMRGYLRMWDLNPTGADAPMAWMDHDLDGERMPGMASPEQVQALRDLPVEEAEVLFLQLMNRHHISGVDMAEAVIERSDNEAVEDLASSMIRVQNAEIEIMNMYLEQKGYEPITPENADMVELVSGAPAATPEDHDGH